MVTENQTQIQASGNKLKYKTNSFSFADLFRGRLINIVFLLEDKQITQICADKPKLLMNSEMKN